MNDFFTYLLWPNPGNASYESPKALALLAVCLVLVLLSFLIRIWRAKRFSPSLRRISGSWSVACFWFGLTGLVLIVARVEQIQFIAMRAIWALWLVILIVYLFFQVRGYRTRYYEVLPSNSPEDPRAKYLPKKKRR